MAEKDEKSCSFRKRKIFMKYRYVYRNPLVMYESVVVNQKSVHCNNAPLY